MLSSFAGYGRADGRNEVQDNQFLTYHVVCAQVGWG